jgi:hypothetical protein
MSAGGGLASAVSLRPPLSRPNRTSVQALALTVLLASFSSLLVVAGGVWIRLVLALVIALLLCTVSLSRPALGVTATLIYLVFVAFLRRLLIPVAPWVSADPLLLVGPVVALVMLVKLFVLERRRLAGDLISKLVLVILAITVAEVVNPTAGGGVLSGLAGLLFMAMPLLWFFIGREVFSDRDVERLLIAVVILGTVVACYGLWQTQVGEPSWDSNWLDVTGGYTALNVGDQLRPFGTFASSSEHALFLGAALAISLSYCLRGRLMAVFPIPLLAVALFLSSARGALVTAAFAVVVLIGLRTGRPSTALAVTLVAAAAAFAGVHFANSSLSSQGSASGALVSHEIGGITDPLNPNSSTLLVHLQLVVTGFKSGLSHPLGQGTAVTNGAAGTINTAVNNNPQATEVDISNAFVAYGVAGGLLYALLVLSVLGAGMRRALGGRIVVFGVLALLLVDLGQWGIGGDYALSPLAWLLAGVLAAPYGATAARRAGRRRRSSSNSSAVSSA